MNTRRLCLVGESFENTDWRILVKSSRILDWVIPAWSAGIQADMDFSRRILRTWMPAIRAGMTRSSFSCFLGERKLKARFVDFYTAT
jgi:hypothetical protein